MSAFHGFKCKLTCEIHDISKYTVVRIYMILCENVYALSSCVFVHLLNKFVTVLDTDLLYCHFTHKRYTETLNHVHLFYAQP